MTLGFSYLCFWVWMPNSRVQRCRSHRLDLFACFPHSWNYRKWAGYQESFRGICLWKWDWNLVCSDSVGLWAHWRLCRNPLAISKSRFCLLGISELFASELVIKFLKWSPWNFLSSFRFIFFSQTLNGTHFFSWFIIVQFTRPISAYFFNVLIWKLK